MQNDQASFGYYGHGRVASQNAGGALNAQQQATPQAPQQQTQSTATLQPGAQPGAQPLAQPLQHQQVAQMQHQHRSFYSYDQHQQQLQPSAAAGYYPQYQYQPLQYQHYNPMQQQGQPQPYGQPQHVGGPGQQAQGQAQHLQQQTSQLGPGAATAQQVQQGQQGQQGQPQHAQLIQPQRPKLTTTFWEDEGTVCYQVESRGISVSRREDTNFINGTKLLNVAGMTRGRRDGILKSEKVRYVVKIGAMNLKGVWIPFERALELARNEGIVDLLYPLFVKDIKELYQGPQYSGGLTAAANSNPKNIVPVTVTSSAYTPGAHSRKTHTHTQSQSHAHSTPQGTPQPPQTSSNSTSAQDQQGHELPQGSQGFSYGYQYQDPYQKGYYSYNQNSEERK